MLESIDIQAIFSDYVMPWSINIVMALLIFVVGRFVVSLLVSLADRLMVKAGMDEMLVNFLVAIVKTILLLFVVVAALDQLGVDTTSMIALIGAAGLAIGLALQDSLKNFASGVMLIVFRPFKAGDFVDAGGTSGVVEVINIFSTTMRTPDNREVIVPNGSIYAVTITNFSARDTRRIDLMIGIGYGDDIRKAKEVLKGILDADERVLDDPEPFIGVAELGESSVNFAVRPWVKTSDFWAAKCDLTERIKLAFDKQGISIPYPQMDVHMNQSE